MSVREKQLQLKLENENFLVESQKINETKGEPLVLFTDESFNF